MPRARSAVLYLALLAFGAALPARAQVDIWTNTINSFWDVIGNWSLGVAPNNTQTADFITNAVSKTVTIDAFTAGSATATLTISNLTLAAPGGAVNTLSMTTGGSTNPLYILNGFAIGAGGALSITNSLLRVDGVSGGGFTIDGTAAEASGTIIATNINTTIGSTNSGVFTLNGGTVLGGRETLGNSAGAPGTFNQSAGTNSVNDLYIGFGAGVNGMYLLSGGSLNVVSTLSVGQMGVGTFTQSGGVNYSAGIVVVGNIVSGNGTYNLLSGTLNSPTAYFGGFGSGAFNNYGGNVAAGTLYIGYGSGSSGSCTQTNGALTVTNSLFVGLGGAASLNQSGGNISANFLYIGRNAASTGTYNFSGGTLSAPYQQLGGPGTGTFSQSGGTNTASTELVVYPNSAYNLTNGLVTAGTIAVGVNAGSSPGVLNQFGGTLVSGGAGFYVGDGANAMGILNQFGGSNTLNGNLLISAGNGTTGIYNFYNGYLSSTALQLAFVGNSQTVGVFNQTSGSNTINGVLSVSCVRHRSCHMRWISLACSLE